MVAYVGQLDATESLIRGSWRIGLLDGPFEMRRDGPVVGVEAKKETYVLKTFLENQKA